MPTNMQDPELQEVENLLVVKESSLPRGHAIHFHVKRVRVHLECPCSNIFDLQKSSPSASSQASFLWQLSVFPTGLFHPVAFPSKAPLPSNCVAKRPTAALLAAPRVMISSPNPSHICRESNGIAENPRNVPLNVTSARGHSPSLCLSLSLSLSLSNPPPFGAETSLCPKPDRNPPPRA